MNNGILINREAWLASQMLQLRERLPKVEKQARKTPPRTLPKEWEKVKHAGLEVGKIRAEMLTMWTEWVDLRQKMGKAVILWIARPQTEEEVKQNLISCYPITSLF